MFPLRSVAFFHLVMRSWQSLSLFGVKPPLARVTLLVVVLFRSIGIVEAMALVMFGWVPKSLFAVPIYGIAMLLIEVMGFGNVLILWTV